MCHRVKDEKELYDSVGHVPVRLKCNDIDTWIKSMCNPETFVDELMLFAMVRTFQHHVVVYGKHRCWCTIGTDDPIDGDRLLDICQVHLVYIGENMFAELRRKPFHTKRQCFVSATPVYDTETPEESQKTEALNLSQSTTIVINTTNSNNVPVIPVVNQDHDYAAVNVSSSRTDDIPEFPEFSRSGVTLPPPPSPAITPATTPSQPESDEALPLGQPSVPSSPSSVASSHNVNADQNVSKNSDNYDNDNTIQYDLNDMNITPLPDALDQTEPPVPLVSDSYLNNEDASVVTGLNTVTENGMVGSTSLNNNDKDAMSGINNSRVDTSRIGLNMHTNVDANGLNGNPTVVETNDNAMTGFNSPKNTGMIGLNIKHQETPDSSTIGLNNQNSSQIEHDNNKPRSVDASACDKLFKNRVNIMENVVNNPVKHVRELWEKDAKKRHWTVDVPRMSTSRMCKLKQLPPDWDKVDPYSSLEETVDMDPEDTHESVEIETKPYALRERKKVILYQSARSRRNISQSVSYRESSDSDSDYTPKPKWEKPLIN